MRSALAKQVIAFLAVLLGVYLILYLGSIFIEVVLAAIVTGILYYLSLPLIAFLERYKVPRVAAIFIVLLIFAGIVVLLLVYLIPVVVGQLVSLAQDAPAVVNQLRQWFQRVETRFGPQIGEARFQELVDRATATATGFIETLAASILGVLANVMSLLIVAIIGVVAAFYLLKDHESIGSHAEKYVPDDAKPSIIEIFDGVNRVLAGFLRGQVIVAVIVGTLAGTALAILGIPYAFLLGVVVAVFEIIPYLGPILGAIPAVLFALSISTTDAILVAAAFFVIQQVESLILSPRIVGAQVHLHPVTVIFAVLVGGHILGVLGVFVAIPVAGVAKVVLQQFMLTREEREEEREED